MNEEVMQDAILRYENDKNPDTKRIKEIAALIVMYMRAESQFEQQEAAETLKRKYNLNAESASKTFRQVIEWLQKNNE